MGLLHPTRDELQIAGVLHALSDPQRLSIVRSLAEDPAPRRCGSFDLDVTKSTLTHHFRVLREAGVIEQREEGTSRSCCGSALKPMMAELLTFTVVRAADGRAGGGRR
jgi:DNA-binding transcriptional ArsR family regulator